MIQAAYREVLLTLIGRDHMKRSWVECVIALTYVFVIAARRTSSAESLLSSDYIIHQINVAIETECDF